MSTQNIKPFNLQQALLATLLFITNTSHASLNTNKINALPQANHQLAYYIGVHYQPNNHYYPPQIHSTYRYHSYWRNHRNHYWINSNHISYHCQKSCVIDRWNGRIIRCYTRCYN